MNGRLILLKSNLFLSFYTRSFLPKIELGLFIIALALLASCQSHPDQNIVNRMAERDTKDCLFDVSALREGDILLREGNGFVSSLIIKALNEANKVSHAGLVVKLNGSLVVFHTLPEVDSLNRNVRLSSVHDFCSNHEALSVYVCRPLESNPDDSSQIRAYVLTHLVLNPPFDPFSDINSVDNLSCSELVLKAMIALNYLPEKVNDSIRAISSPLGFNLFFDKRYFKTILSQKSH